MQRVRLVAWTLCFVSLTTIPSLVLAIEIGQVDDFEDGTTMAWSEGFQSVTPPTNVSDGGPSGAGDNYLADESSGIINEPGGRMAVYNRVQWAGDYVAAGVNAITVTMANFGEAPLSMRVAVNSNGNQWGSTVAFTLPSDGQWYEHTFRLTAAHMTDLALAGTLQDALLDVSEMRFVSVALGPSWMGDFIVGSLGIDDVTAVAVPTATGDASWSAVKSSFE